MARRRRGSAKSENNGNGGQRIEDWSSRYMPEQTLMSGELDVGLSLNISSAA